MVSRMTDTPRERFGSGPGWVTFLITQLGAVGSQRFAERIEPLGLTPADAGLLRAIGRIAHQHGQDMLAPLDEQDRALLGGLLGRLATHHGPTPRVLNCSLWCEHS